MGAVIQVLWAPLLLPLWLEHIFHSAPQYSFYLDSRSSWWKESSERGAPAALEESRSWEPQLPWVTVVDAWDTEDQASNFQHFPFKNYFLSPIRKRTPEHFLWYKFTFWTVSNSIKKKKKRLIAWPVSWPLWSLWILSLTPSALYHMYLRQNYCFLWFMIY